MKDIYHVIKTPSITEKGNLLSKNNQYVFIVHARANKIEIKAAVEYLFQRKVQSVNIVNRRGKTKRTRFGVGQRPDSKRAIVSLRKGEAAIEHF